MAYIGNQPTIGQYRKLDDISGSFNGSLTAFTMQVGSTNVNAGSVFQLLISLGGVIQNPGTDFTVSGSTLTFTTAPTSGLDFFGILMGQPLNTATPGDSTVTGAKIVDGTITGAKLAAAFNYDSGLLFLDDTNNRVGIGTTSPSFKTEIVDTLQADANLHYSLVVRGDDSGTDDESAQIFLSAINATSRGAAIAAIRNSGSNDHSLAFKTSAASAAPTERARIDSSGRLLVGATTNSYSNVKFLVAGANSSNYMSVLNTTASDANESRYSFLHFRGTQSGGEESSLVSIAAMHDGSADDQKGLLSFRTNAGSDNNAPTERMRINSVGGLKVSSNAAAYVTSSTSAQHEITTDINGGEVLYITNRNSTSPLGVQIWYPTDVNNTANNFLACYGTSTLRAAFRSNGGLANFSANNVNLSDINVKKDISSAAGTWDCLKDWEIVNFRYKDQPDDADLTMGVIAQQVAVNCPEVVTVFQEAKEATEDQPAQEERLGVKDQQMMWMAIKALQEAQTRIETLEAEVAALKGA